MMDALSAQEAIQPRLLALEQQYTPLWQEVQRKALLNQQNIQNELYAQQIPKSAELSSQYASAMAPAFGQIGATARSAYEQTLDPSVRGLLGGLGQQAQEGLTLGSALSAAETQQAQQAARAAMAARGLTGNQAVSQEVLNTFNMGQARQLQRQQLAASVYGMGQQSAQQAMGLYGGTMIGAAQGFSPTSAYQMATAANQGLGPQFFQPESQYNASLITANRKEAMDVAIANQQASNANRLAAINAVGQIAGSAIGAFGGGGIGSTGSSMGNLGGQFSSASGGSAIGGGLNLGNYSLGGGGAGISNMSGGGYSFSSGNGFNKMK